MGSFRRCSAVLVVAAGLLTTACAEEPEPDAAPSSSFSVEPAEGTSSSASGSPTPSPTRTENDRGDVVKEVGEVASMVSEANPEVRWLRFKVTDLQEAECTSGYSEEPAEGNHLLQIDLEVQTQKEMREAFEEQGASPTAMMFNTDWYAYASNGTTMNAPDTGAAYSCLDSADQIPDMIGPAEKAVGSVVLEVSDVSGEVAFRPWFGGGTGWAWEYDLSETK